MSKPDTSAQGTPSVLTVARPNSQTSLSELLSQLMKISDILKSNPMHIAREYVRTAVGPGKISPDDFIRLRLFDTALYGGADVREFVGDRCMRDICLTVNYRHDWFGMLFNKVASISYLEAYGIATIPVKAIYAPRMGSEDSSILSERSALEHFLLQAQMYPMFGKPIESMNSLGSIALISCSPASGEVVTGTGKRVPAKDLAAEIDTQYPTGYLFQELASPHPAIAALSGERLATVRFLTIAAQSGVQIARACWKIPSGDNMADNYWRSGNLLAQLDLESGRVLRVTSGTGLEMQEHTTHPETKMPLIGSVHPQWEEMKALALRGARLMNNVPLIGWDIACTEKGPVVVEMNEYPDSFLVQFADRRGLLDDTFKQFIEFQKRNRTAFNIEAKAHYTGM